MNQILADVTRTLPPTDIELAAVVRNFHTARVLVIGDVILDRYISGAVHRLSPEAPIPVLRPATNQCTLGGAANVALNIATLGGQAILIGVIGDDAAGDEVRRLVAATPGVASAMVRIAGRPTTSKTRFMTGSHQLLRLDEETTAPLDRAGVAAILEAVEQQL
ncbi:MAG TPA: PfkB family carbohydrate kinase, partial [Rhodopila sp.]